MPTLCAPCPGKRKAILLMTIAGWKTVAELLRLGHLHHRAVHIVPAGGANNVLRQGGAALGAVRELLGGLGVVSPSLAAAGIGVFSLGNGHGTDSQSGSAAPGRGLFWIGKPLML